MFPTTRFMLLMWIGLVSGSSHAAVTTTPIEGHHEQQGVTQYSPTTCQVKVNTRSAKYVQDTFSKGDYNFARLRLEFGDANVNFTPQVIQPFDWLWTYYDFHALFSYLKWPSDFPILSLGLLDAKSLPNGRYLRLDVVNTTQCQLTIGTEEGTRHIAEALKNFTRDYLQPLRHPPSSPSVAYSYWCYLAEVTDTHGPLTRLLHVYTGYPMEAAAYNCCNTFTDLLDNNTMHTNCKRKQIVQDIDSSTVPYVMSLVAFAFFPIFLLKASNSITHTYETADADDVSDDDGQTGERLLLYSREKTTPYVYLDGTPPINMSRLLGGMCGLVRSYPNAVSRLRRFIFVAVSPCLIFVRLYVYRLYMYPNVMALLKHGISLGFVSMIGGFETSRHVFMTVLGGPFVILGVFYVASMFFLVFPTNMDKLFEEGSNRNSPWAAYSPLFFSVQFIEKYSGGDIMNKHGYGKAASICSCGLYMLCNPSFWWFAVTLQVRRVYRLYNQLHECTDNKVCCWLILLPLMPVFLALSLSEICLTVILYGLPLVNFMHIIVRGYMLSLAQLFSSNAFMSRLGKRPRVVCRVLTTLLVSVCFLYYVFSLATIFIDTFIFIAKVVFFSFLSVIVYPSTSFGYLFFGILLFYYIVKTVAKFGEDYLELLADAVEISCQLDNDPYKMHITEGTLIVNDIKSNTITQLQINDTVINLSRDQRQSIRDSRCTDISCVRYRKHVAGIPRELFLDLVKRYRPVHIQISRALLKIGLILALISITKGIISKKPLGSNESISEVMHVVFLMAIGALPKVLEVAMDNMNHSMKKDIQLRKMREDIIRYWQTHSVLDSINVANQLNDNGGL